MVYSTQVRCIDQKKRRLTEVHLIENDDSIGAVLRTTTLRVHQNYIIILLRQLFIDNGCSSHLVSRALRDNESGLCSCLFAQELILADLLTKR